MIIHIRDINMSMEKARGIWGLLFLEFGIRYNRDYWRVVDKFGGYYFRCGT